MERPMVVDKLQGSVVSGEFVRYFLASVVAFFADYSLFWICLRVFNLGWALSASFGFILGVFLSYVLSIFWVFRSRRFEDNYAREFLSFFVVGVLGLLLTQAVLWLGIYKLEISAEFARLVAAGSTFVFNFVARKIFLFMRAV
ncbi:GtrA family protein [Pseudomonas citronellolis]|uniref:GtrA family protein n=1 Tax=Pseudomonas citronellolis TaxID=53408 RepID=A0AAW6PB27_9PSED|nr:GtrA family protein [Pseudomonas citronellolis]MDF3844738.1 GtrA family protein [Pseudomonas citronellolis]